jgi:hypothetical protein
MLSMILINVSYAFSQRCATHMYHQKMQEANPDYYQKISDFSNFLNQLPNQDKKRDNVLQSEAIYKIPVVVHVLHNSLEGTVGGSGNWNITDEQIKSQIEVLNEDYRKIAGTRGFNTHPQGADVMIEFCLAAKSPDGKSSTGIIRKFWSTTPLSPSNLGEIAAFKAVSIWPTDLYLNLWVTDIDKNIAGFAQFPRGSGLEGIDASNGKDEEDGIVIDYLNFGRVGELEPKYNLGRTCTHEVAHWLGLLHLWGDAFCGNDFVEDTPPQAGSNTNLSTLCPQTFSKCAGNTTADFNFNYLDFSPDVCMNMFTVLQKKRMRTAIENSPRRLKVVNNANACDHNISTDDQEVFTNSHWFANIDDELFLCSSKSLTDVKVEVFTMLGQKLQSFYFDSTTDKQRLDISKKTNGILIIKVSTSELNTSHKIWFNN